MGEISEVLVVPAETVKPEIPGYKELFESRKTGILTTLSASLKTTYGNETLSPAVLDPQIDYKTFRKSVPILEPGTMTDNPKRFVNSEKLPIEQMTKLTSGATTGKPKETYYDPSDTKIELPTYIVEKLNASSGTMLFHEARDAVSHRVIEEAIERYAPAAERETYTHAEDVIKKIKEKKSQAVYLTCQVSAARRFMDELQTMLTKNPELFEKVEVPNFFLELVAEPVSIEEIKSWHDLLARAFKHPPDIAVPYALSEAFVIGVYAYKPGDTEFRYKVKDSRFVEVLDPQTKEPIVGQVGDIVITPCNKTTGSIYPRYLSGDRAALNIDEQGDSYLSEIGRDPEKGQINLRGYKIYAPALYNSLGERFGFPVNLRFQVVELNDGSITTLKINMLSSRFADEEQRKHAISSLKAFLIKEYDFLELSESNGVLQNKGGLKVALDTVDNVPPDMQKGWQVLPKQTAST